MVISIGTGVPKVNNPNSLSEFGGNVILTDMWARGVMKSMEWAKRKGITSKVEPSKQLLTQEKCTFQMSKVDIPSELIINFDQPQLSYISPGKYTFNIKGAKSIPLKDNEDKR